MPLVIGKIRSPDNNNNKPKIQGIIKQNLFPHNHTSDGRENPLKKER
jgi:hypothetical protein